MDTTDAWPLDVAYLEGDERHIGGERVGRLRGALGRAHCVRTDSVRRCLQHDHTVLKTGRVRAHLCTCLGHHSLPQCDVHVQHTAHTQQTVHTLLYTLYSV